MTASLSGASLRLLVRRRAELPREPECGLQHAVHLVRVRVRVRVRVGVGVGVGVGVRVRVVGLGLGLWLATVLGLLS